MCATPALCLPPPRLLCCPRAGQVNSATRQGDQVVLELEPAKGGDKTSLTVDVVLVSAGAG